MWSIILLLFSLQCCWAAECSRQNGPEWGNDCREASPGEYEWWTCLNTTYIKQQTGNKVFCKYTRAKYCWTPCTIIKKYFKHPILMPLPEDCSCDPDALPTRSPSLPSDCYSPSGHSCDWYRNCLEKSHPCEATTNAYALKYAEKFCRLYDDQKSTFSQLGQQWIDAVRKCLQVALVQLLYPWSKSSCRDIRDRAFDSHIPCYLNPGKDTPSVCDLDCAEYFKIFFTIKGSFTELSTAWRSMEGMWHIGTKCAARKCLTAGFRPVIKGGGIVKEEFIRVGQIFVKMFKSKRKRRSSDFPLEGDAKYQFADRVGSAIAKAMNWDTEIVDWLAYPETLRGTNNPGVEDTQEITIVLADKKAINMTKTPKPSVDFNGAFNALASVIETGKLPLHVNDYKVWVKSLASCSDKSCNETQTVAISDKPPKWIAHAGTKSIGNFSFLGCFSIWFILGQNLIF